MTFVFKLHGMWHHFSDFRNRQVCRDPSFVESNLRRRFKICIFDPALTPILLVINGTNRQSLTEFYSVKTLKYGDF